MQNYRYVLEGAPENDTGNFVNYYITASNILNILH